MERLLTLGLDVFIRDTNQWTAMHWAASEGHADVILELLECGAPLMAEDVNRRIPLHW